LEPVISTLTVKEQGVTVFITQLLQQYPKLLKKHFPMHWQTIMDLSYGRILHQAPIKKYGIPFSA